MLTFKLAGDKPVLSWEVSQPINPRSLTTTHLLTGSVFADPYGVFRPGKTRFFRSSIYGGYNWVEVELGFRDLTRTPVTVTDMIPYFTELQRRIDLVNHEFDYGVVETCDLLPIGVVPKDLW